MGTINLEDIQPGMVLEKDVIDRSGRTLLGANQEIRERHLRIFKMWGVTEADVLNITKEEISAKASAQLDPALLREAEEEARDLFCHADMSHPFNRELFRLLTFRMVNRIPRGAP
jgi:hypothetical protein